MHRDHCSSLHNAPSPRPGRARSPSPSRQASKTPAPVDTGMLTPHVTPPAMDGDFVDVSLSLDQRVAVAAKAEQHDENRRPKRKPTDRVKDKIRSTLRPRRHTDAVRAVSTDALPTRTPLQTSSQSELGAHDYDFAADDEPPVLDACVLLAVWMGQAQLPTALGRLVTLCSDEGYECRAVMPTSVPPPPSSTRAGSKKHDPKILSEVEWADLQAELTQLREKTEATEAEANASKAQLAQQKERLRYLEEERLVLLERVQVLTEGQRSAGMDWDGSDDEHEYDDNFWDETRRQPRPQQPRRFVCPDDLAGDIEREVGARLAGSNDQVAAAGEAGVVLPTAIVAMRREWEAERSSMQAQIQQHGGLQGELQERTEQLLVLGQELERLQDELMTLRNDSEAMALAADAERVGWQAREQALKTANYQLTCELEAAADDTEALRAELQRAREQIEEGQAALAKEQEERESDNIFIYTALEKDMNNLRAEVQGLKAEVKVLQQQRSALEGTNVELYRSLQDTQARWRGEFERTHAAHREQLDALQAVLKTRSALCDTLCQKVAELEAEVGELRHSNEQLQEECEQQRREAECLGEEAQGYGDRLEGIRRERDQTLERLAQAEAKERRASQGQEVMRREIESLRRSMGIAQMLEQQQQQQQAPDPPKPSPSAAPHLLPLLQSHTTPLWEEDSAEDDEPSPPIKGPARTHSLTALPLEEEDMAPKKELKRYHSVFGFPRTKAVGSS